MRYNIWLNEHNALAEERYELSILRIGEIATMEESELKASKEVGAYFKKVAEFILMCDKTYRLILSGAFRDLSLDTLANENRAYYADILPDRYESSFANPAYAVKVLGEEYGRILSFLYTELRSIREYVFMQDREKIAMLMELFLEIYFLFTQETVSYKQLRDTVYGYLYDYADEWVNWRIRQQVDPDVDFATQIIKEADLTDYRYLYYFGEYISDVELDLAAFLNTLPEEEIQEIALTYAKGYQQGFVLKGVDLTKKVTVNIRYSIGFERVIREAISYFEGLGLRPVLYPAAKNTINKRQNIRIGYISSNPNEQYDYDHRFDDAIYMDKRMIDRKISCMRKAYEEFAQEAAGFAGPACFEMFGEKPFEPVSKPEAYRLSERQQNLKVEYSTLSNALMNEFINQEERSFTIISYPAPCIGPQFEEIFDAIHKVNTLDNEIYKTIQQRMIAVLDQASHVKIMGRKRNMTNLTIQMQEISDPTKETSFENCLADVNIPLGEVFTSPRLTGTNGLLHVTNVYLEGLNYRDLRIWFEDGMVKDYSCANYEDPEEGKRYIKENLLYGRDTLPIGEFAIGTNTTAYVMATRYDIIRQLPILIAEKMGPHIAIGDTCYSYCEEVAVYNPDGKEVIARENECSMLRHENPKKAYFNCHTDITIPYEELDRIVAVTKDRIEIPIILSGRFVLDGTLDLNNPFMGSHETGE